MYGEGRDALLSQTLLAAQREAIDSATCGEYQPRRGRISKFTPSCA
jgi:hypothetical protein